MGDESHPEGDQVLPRFRRHTAAIRSSDFKANIALLFLPLLMVPILSGHEKNFQQIPLWLILAPFLTAYIYSDHGDFSQPRVRTEKSNFICRAMRLPTTLSSTVTFRSSSRRASAGSPSSLASSTGRRAT
jgi:hypothetical protein